MKTLIYIIDNEGNPSEDTIRIYDHPLYLKHGQNLLFGGGKYKVENIEISLDENCFKLFIGKV